MSHSNDHILDHVDDYHYDLLSAAEMAAIDRHCEQCPECKSAFEAAQRRLQAVRSLPPSEASEGLIQQTLARIQDDDERRRLRRRRLVRGFLVAVAASVTILAVLNIHYANLSASPYDLKVIGQNQLIPGAPGSLRIQLMDRQTGTALAGVPIDVELRGPEVVQLASFTTDAGGTGKPRFQLPDWNNGDFELRVSARLSRDTETVSQRIKLKRSWKLMLSSDKPVYQPGQEIRLRVLALRRPDLKPVAKQAALFTIADPRGNIIFKKEATTSAYGIASGDCPLASEINEGPYSITCRIGDTESKRTVEVKKYVLPKFKIDVELDKPYYQPGETATGTVKADYFFGKPVADAAVQVEVLTTDVETRTVFSVNKTTDATGQTKFSFEVPSGLIGREQHSGAAKISIRATVTDTAGQKQTKAVTRNVTNKVVRIVAFPEGGTLVKGVLNNLFIFVTYADGAPATKGRMKIDFKGCQPKRPTQHTKFGFALHSEGYIEFPIVPTASQVELSVQFVDKAQGRGEEGPAYNQAFRLTCGDPIRDFLLRTDKAVYNSGDTMRLTALGDSLSTIYLDLLKDGQTVLTDTIDLRNGQGEYHLDLPAELFGTVELVAYRFGADGLPIRKSRVLYVRPAQELAIKTTLDQAEYRPGRPAKLTFALTDGQGKPAPGALSLAAVDEAVFAVLDQAPGMEKTFYLLEQELLKPVYTIYPWSPGPARPPSDFSEVERLRFERDRNNLTQALFARTASSSVEYGAEWRGNRAGSSQPYFPPTRMREAPTSDADSATVYAREPYSMTLSSYVRKWAAAQSTKRTALEWVGIGWTVVVLAVIAGGIVWLCVIFTVKRMLPVFAVWGLLIFCVIGLLLPATQRVREASPAARALNDARQAEFERVSQQAAAEAQKGALRVRENFPETLLWKPELVTDEQGRATLDLDVADSITTWRLSASAVTADGRLGAAQTPIKVFQPFFVDLNLPVALTRQDEVAVPVVVYNYLKEPQTVELMLEKGSWFELTGGVTQRLELAANEVRATSYRIKAVKAGNHHLQVTARGQGDIADAIKRDIEVVPEGRRVEQVVTDRWAGNSVQTVTIPEHAVPDSAKVLVKLYPGVYSQVIEGLEGMLRMPTGCFEQTSSSAYPNLLVMEYLQRSRTASPALLARAEQLVHVGYQRLLTFEVSGGGFEWYGRSPAVLWLSAYGLQEFNDMSRVYPVDRAIIERTQRWLLKQQAADGSWAANSPLPIGGEGRVRGSNADAEGRLLITSYVAWALADSGSRLPEVDRAIAYIRTHLDDAGSNAYVLALAANALVAWDAKDDGTLQLLRRLEQLHADKAEWNACYWRGSRTLTYAVGDSASIETTALAALAMTKAGVFPDTVNRALTYLVKSKSGSGTWGSTSATILSLKALVAGMSGVKQEGNVRFTILVNGKEAAKGEVTPFNADVMQLFDLKEQVRGGANEIAIRADGPTNMMYQIVGRYHEPWSRQQEVAVKPAIDLKITYDRTELTTADRLKARVTLRNNSKEPSRMVMVDLGVPPGFTADAADFDALVQQKRIDKYSLTARQIILYVGDVRPGDELLFTYSLKPRFPLKAQTPPAIAYEYYTPANRTVAPPVELTVR